MEKVNQSNVLEFLTNGETNSSQKFLLIKDVEIMKTLILELESWIRSIQSIDLMHLKKIFDLIYTSDFLDYSYFLVWIDSENYNQNLFSIIAFVWYSKIKFDTHHCREYLDKLERKTHLYNDLFRVLYLEIQCNNDSEVHGQHLLGGKKYGFLITKTFLNDKINFSNSTIPNLILSSNYKIIDKFLSYYQNEINSFTMFGDHLIQLLKILYYIDKTKINIDIYYNSLKFFFKNFALVNEKLSNQYKYFGYENVYKTMFNQLCFSNETFQGLSKSQTDSLVPYIKLNIQIFHENPNGFKFLIETFGQIFDNELQFHYISCKKCNYNESYFSSNYKTDSLVNLFKELQFHDKNINFKFLNQILENYSNHEVLNLNNNFNFIFNPYKPLSNSNIQKIIQNQKLIFLKYYDLFIERIFGLVEINNEYIDIIKFIIEEFGKNRFLAFHNDYLLLLQNIYYNNTKLNISVLKNIISVYSVFKEQYNMNDIIQWIKKFQTTQPQNKYIVIECFLNEFKDEDIQFHLNHITSMVFPIYYIENSAPTLSSIVYLLGHHYSFSNLRNSKYYYLWLKNLISLLNSNLSNNRLKREVTSYFKLILNLLLMTGEKGEMKPILQLLLQYSNQINLPFEFSVVFLKIISFFGDDNFVNFNQIFEKRSEYSGLNMNLLLGYCLQSKKWESSSLNLWLPLSNHSILYDYYRHFCKREYPNVINFINQSSEPEFIKVVSQIDSNIYQPVTKALLLDRIENCQPELQTTIKSQVDFLKKDSKSHSFLLPYQVIFQIMKFIFLNDEVSIQKKIQMALISKKCFDYTSMLLTFYPIDNITVKSNISTSEWCLIKAIYPKFNSKDTLFFPMKYLSKDYFKAISSFESDFNSIQSIDCFNRMKRLKELICIVSPNNPYSEDIFKSTIQKSTLKRIETLEIHLFSTFKGLDSILHLLKSNSNLKNILIHQVENDHISHHVSTVTKLFKLSVERKFNLETILSITSRFREYQHLNDFIQLQSKLVVYDSSKISILPLHFEQFRLIRVKEIEIHDVQTTTIDSINQMVQKCPILERVLIKVSQKSQTLITQLLESPTLSFKSIILYVPSNENTIEMLQSLPESLRPTLESLTVLLPYNTFFEGDTKSLISKKYLNLQFVGKNMKYSNQPEPTYKKQKLFQLSLTYNKINLQN